MDLHSFVASLITGITYGSIYGLFAMAIVLLYRTNHLFNFAQTETTTFLVIIMFFLLKKMPLWPALGLSLVISFFLGCILHVSVIRVIIERKNVVKTNLDVITIGMFYIFNSASLYFFGDEPEPFPSLWPTGSVDIFTVSVPYGHLAVLGCCIVIGVSIMLFFKYTRLGLVLEAVAENLEAARLRGVRTSNVLAISWGITFALSAFCGIILAPALFLSSSMLVPVFSYALISIIIGGLESPFGALIGGIIVGLAESFATAWPPLGSQLKFVAVLAVLLLVLIVRPRGLWGRFEQRRV